MPAKSFRRRASRLSAKGNKVTPLELAQQVQKRVINKKIQRPDGTLVETKTKITITEPVSEKTLSKLS